MKEPKISDFLALLQILLTVLGLTMPIFGEETEVKRQDKRGILGLSHGGFEGSLPHGNSLAGGFGAGNIYLIFILFFFIQI